MELVTLVLQIGFVQKQRSWTNFNTGKFYFELALEDRARQTDKKNFIKVIFLYFYIRCARSDYDNSSQFYARFMSSCDFFRNINSLVYKLEKFFTLSILLFMLFCSATCFCICAKTNKTAKHITRIYDI